MVMGRPPKRETKSNRTLTIRLNVDYAEKISELVELTGMTKTDLILFCFDFTKENFNSNDIRSSFNNATKKANDRTMTVRLTPEYEKKINKFAKIIGLTKTDAILFCVDVTSREFDTKTINDLFRMEQDFKTDLNDRLRDTIEEDVLRGLEEYELRLRDDFECTLDEMEEEALNGGNEFDRESALSNFEKNKLPKLLQRKEERLYKQFRVEIDKHIEKKWKSEKYQFVRNYFNL